MRRDRVQALVVRDKRILLVRHKMNGRDFFCLPGGGLEKGETYEEAVLRELKEESCVEGRVIRKLSVQYKPDDLGEVHTFLVEIDDNANPMPGTDPELPKEEQTIVDVKWLALDELGAVDRAYLWAAGLNRITLFHKILLSSDNGSYE